MLLFCYSLLPHTVTAGHPGPLIDGLCIPQAVAFLITLRRYVFWSPT